MLKRKWICAQDMSSDDEATRSRQTQMTVTISCDCTHAQTSTLLIHDKHITQCYWHYHTQPAMVNGIRVSVYRYETQTRHLMRWNKLRRALLPSARVHTFRDKASIHLLEYLQFFPPQIESSDATMSVAILVTSRSKAEVEPRI